MKLEKSLFRDTTTVTSRYGAPSVGNPGQYLPPKVSEVGKDLIRNFPHSKRVGNYILGRTLGEGSFAKVREALHVLTGEKVAIKVIDKKKAKEDAYVRKNMRREGKLLQGVRHRHVIQLYELMETENSYYLVTELCRGGDLMDHICSKKRLDEKETKKYIRQIISAVHHLHTAGILHRDLKVENLLLDENKDVKIIDFGLSNSIRVNHVNDGSVAQEFCVTQCGSPAYAAPELLGNKKYGHKVDIWSIGVNMYAMLTGNLPFTVEPFNIKNLHQKMINSDMNPIPDTLTKNGRDFLRRLLTPNPDIRVTLQEAMSHPWIADALARPMAPAPFPNKLNADDLDNNILKHMSQNLDYRLSEAIRLVSNNVPSNATATYHMFSRKLNRYNAEMRVQGKVAAAEAQLISSSRSTQNTSGYVSRDDVIDLIPMGNSVANGREVKAPDTSETADEDVEKNSSQQVSGQSTSPVRLLERPTENVVHQTDHQLDKTPHSAAAALYNKDARRRNSQDRKLFKDVSNQRPATTAETTGPQKKSDHPWSRHHGRKMSTNETKIFNSGNGSTTERHKHLSLQTDLPAIAEKPSSSEDTDTITRTPTKTKRSPFAIRRTVRDSQPSSSYSFHPRGLFMGSKNKETTVVQRRNFVLSREATDAKKNPLPTSSDSTTSSNEHKIVLGSGPSGDTANRVASPYQNGRHSISDPSTRREKLGLQHMVGDTQKGSINASKLSPRRVMIDVAHYEQYTRKNGHFLPSDIANNNVSIQYTDKNGRRNGDAHGRKLISLVYPTFNKTVRSQGKQSFQTYNRNRRLSNGDGLNVTGEKTGVAGTKTSNFVRESVADDFASPRPQKVVAEEQDEIEINQAIQAYCGATNVVNFHTNDSTEKTFHPHPNKDSDVTFFPPLSPPS